MTAQIEPVQDLTKYPVIKCFIVTDFFIFRLAWIFKQFNYVYCIAMLTLHLLILYFLVLMHSIYLFTFIAWIKYTKCLSEHSPIILQPLFTVKGLENTSIMILQCSLLNFSPFTNKHYQYLAQLYPLICDANDWSEFLLI